MNGLAADEGKSLGGLLRLAVYPQTRYLSQHARQFIDFLVERFGDKPFWDRH
ncbi:MAG: hypothetical protein OES90_06375 [Xanthomonadales bacterium]|nr:hypothetical protein [Xanthomonadales bacterium]